MKIVITKTRSGYYTLTVRNHKGKLIFRSSYESLEKAQTMADMFQDPADDPLYAALNPCGR